MRVYVLVFSIHFPYEGDNVDNIGVYSTRKKACEAAREFIRKDYPGAKREGRKDIWDLVPGSYDHYDLRVEGHVLDA